MTGNVKKNEPLIPKKRLLYQTYRSAMAFIEVELPDGSISIGSAFHVGEGVFVTARHVVEANRILKMATTFGYYIPDDNGLITIHGDPQRYRSINSQVLTIKSGPYYHPETKIDVACIVVHQTNITVVPLGSHLDDLLNDEAFIMAETIVMGYPPIPFSDSPTLVTASAEINAVIDMYNAKHPRFIISAMPRGGFSGGLCLIEWNFVLGLITESLVTSGQVSETGFMAVLTVEPIYVCLRHHGIMPPQQKVGWDGLWDRDFDEPSETDETPF